MSAIDRSLIIAGPAYIVRDGATIVTKGDITVKPVLSKFDVETSIHGPVSARLSDRVLEISFTPAGVVENALLPKLWPHRAAAGYTLIGASVFGAADVPAVIYSSAGQTFTFHATAITKMPNITIKATETSLGDMTITAINRTNMDPTNAASIFTIGSQVWADPGIDKSDIPTVPASGAWGAVAPWDDFETFDGWSIEFSLALTDITVDSIGTVDKRLKNLTVSAKARPMPTDAALAEAQVFAAMALQGANARRGADLSTANNLVITSQIAGGLIVTLTKAAMIDGGALYGIDAMRNSECTWQACKDGTNALFSLAVA